MRHLLVSSRAVMIGIASALAVAAIFGGAQAATDNIYRYSTPKVGSFTIDHIAMIPNSSPPVDFTNDAGLHSTANGTACFNAGVNLPTGSVITALRVYYKSSAPGDVSAYLLRQSLDTGIKMQLGATLFTSNSNTRTSGTVPLDNTPAPNLTVNNNLYAYGLTICLSHTTEYFHAARISYTYQQAGD